TVTVTDHLPETRETALLRRLPPASRTRRSATRTAASWVARGPGGGVRPCAAVVGPSLAGRAAGRLRDWGGRYWQNRPGGGLRRACGWRRGAVARSRAVHRTVWGWRSLSPRAGGARTAVSRA